MSKQKLEIIQLVKENPRKGLEKLFEKYSNKLFSYCVSNWDFSEDEGWDLIYSTFETILDSIKGYDFESERHFENFLFKVFKNNLRQLYRKQKALLEHIQFVPLELEGLEKEGEKLFGQMHDEDLKVSSPQIELLNHALERLNDSDRELLLLRGQNFSYEQIASFLGIEDNQLKVKAHRAKKKLVDLMIKLQNAEQ
ncbi:sigma-70 family RNA polymerase sigma factor [Roseivirga sp. UBA838]|uniref:RNA polymerase sigma factor n=1 Tax=Roseivirga sp. UBA838 TaxID=1947393 RepID=UPI002579DCB7|nr:sigma-70 family RNA polymerase sigma factor [Roseivirga sp. UBA838]|tara:strand:- start:37229 stop:37816 length:588 start_codon:yes stop_codon:yes gene_type:complete